MGEGGHRGLRAADNGLTLTIPERRYELIAAILTEAIAEKPTDAGEAARIQARGRGKRYGRQFANGQSGKPLAVAVKALTELGFEPDQGEPDLVILRNCPFHALAVDQPELVCGLNHSFIEGLIRGLDAGGLTSIRPRPARAAWRSALATVNRTTPLHDGIDDDGE